MILHHIYENFTDFVSAIEVPI